MSAMVPDSVHTERRRHYGDKETTASAPKKRGLRRDYVKGQSTSFFFWFDSSLFAFRGFVSYTMRSIEAINRVAFDYVAVAYTEIQSRVANTHALWKSPKIPRSQYHRNAKYR